jgi:Vanillate O-demethylase oxygenase C-terminal domain
VHYFVVHGRNFALDDSGITDYMQQQLFAAFDEDVKGLEAIEQLLDETPVDDVYEVSVPSDRAALAMRQYLKKLSDAEQEQRLTLINGKPG